MYAAIEGCERVLATALTSQFVFCSSVPATQVFSHSLGVFSREEYLPILQSQLHSIWSIFQGSSLEERIRYTPSDCFETFPFPLCILESTVSDPTSEVTLKNLEAIGTRYHEFRAELLVSSNEGLTSTYGLFHNPSETSSGILELRRLHEEMDQSVLTAYGWSDLPTACGFGLDYLDTSEDAQLPDDLQERIDNGELFFWDANEALHFQGQLQAYGAVTGRRKLPWRYRWPDEVCDEVLARLLALNAERYAEEVAQGLHGKTKSTRPKKRLATTAKAEQQLGIGGVV